MRGDGPFWRLLAPGDTAGNGSAPPLASSATEDAGDTSLGEVEGSEARAAQASPAATTAPVPSPEPATPAWTDRLRALGVDLPADASEDAVLHSLASAHERARQTDYYAQVGQAVGPDLEAFRQWKAQQAQAVERQAQAVRAWNPPEYNPAWAEMVEVREDGSVVAKPGQDPAVARKLLEHDRYVRDWWAQTRSDPSRLAAVVEDRILERVRQELSATDRDRQAREIIERNGSWLYAVSGEGEARQLVRDQQGRPQLSPAGYLYVRALQDYNRHVAAHGGAVDPVLADQWARQTAAGQLAQYQLQQAQGAPGTQTPSQQLTTQRATRSGSRNSVQVKKAFEGGQDAGSSRSSQGLDPVEMLRKSFADKGIDDSKLDIANAR